jgi:hypothetical protein
MDLIAAVIVILVLFTLALCWFWYPSPRPSPPTSNQPLVSSRQLPNNNNKKNHTKNPSLPNKQKNYARHPALTTIYSASAHREDKSASNLPLDD